MTTNRIQPTDTIFVVDLQTEEIYEMTAGEFANLYGINGSFRINYDSNADAYCVEILFPSTGEIIRSNFWPTYDDAADDLFLRRFSAASYNPGVTWSKQLKQAQTMLRLHMDNKLSEALVR